MRAGTRLMVSFARWVLCVSVTMACAAPAMAGEVKTECPSTHPERPGMRLDYGECLPVGEYPWSWVPDEKIDHGNNIFTAIDIYRRDTKNDPLRKAKIECNYKDRSILHVPVPGALLRCGIKYRLPDFQNLKNREEMDSEILHVWAISEVEGKPEPSK